MSRFLNGLPRSVIDRYLDEHPEEQRTAAKESDASTQHVPVRDIPMTSWGHAGPLPHPYAVSADDHPQRYTGDFPEHLTYSLHHVPLSEVAKTDCHNGKPHGAHCYEWDGDYAHHDNSSEGAPGEPDFFNDADQVRDMAKTPEHLPALIEHPDGGMWGGGHRTAAWAEAGWTHVPMWKPDQS